MNKRNYIRENCCKLCGSRLYLNKDSGFWECYSCGSIQMEETLEKFYRQKEELT